MEEFPMKAKDLMTKDPACCNTDTSLREVARLMVDCNCGEIPVVDESERPIGVVTDRDITCRTVAEGKNPLQMTASEVMSTPCVTVSQNASIEECARIMEDNLIRRVPVVDERGCCCGIVSQADLAKKMDEVAAEVLRHVSQPTRNPSNVGRR
jgi:CBS-domain-containing membrane protein